MRVGRGQILLRGLRMRCPNCGARGVFRGFFGINERCPVCGLLFEREEGFWLGAMVIAFIAGSLPVLPYLVLVYLDVFDWRWMLAAGLAWGVIFPILFYNMSKSLWMAAYYIVFRKDLPANNEGRPVVRPR